MLSISVVTSFFVVSDYWETLPGALGVNLIASGVTELITRLDSSLITLNNAGDDPPV